MQAGRQSAVSNGVGMSELVSTRSRNEASESLTQQIAQTMDGRLETLTDRAIFRQFVPFSAHPPRRRILAGVRDTD